MQLNSKFSSKIGIFRINAPATLAVNKFHNAISKNCFMLVYISAHTIVKLTLNKVLLLLLLKWMNVIQDTQRVLKLPPEQRA